MADRPQHDAPSEESEGDAIYLCTYCYSMVHKVEGCCPKCGRTIQ